MGNTVFHFKEFSVVQAQSAMKVGTDGVLLGAWVPLEGVARILDVGTGTGLIALMLAQRKPDAVVTGIDIDEVSCLEASANFAASPWRNRLETVHSSLQQFGRQQSEKLDLIVTNPPYFSRSLPAQTLRKTMARHNDTLGVSDLIMAAKRLLVQKGTLALILPINEFASFSEMACEQGLHEYRKMTVYPLAGKPAHRIMSVWGFNKPKNNIEENLVIEENGRHVYTEAYRYLTREFYLNMP